MWSRDISNHFKSIFESKLKIRTQRRFFAICSEKKSHFFQLFGEKSAFVGFSEKKKSQQTRSQNFFSCKTLLRRLKDILKKFVNLKTKIEVHCRFLRLPSDSSVHFCSFFQQKTKNHVFLNFLSTVETGVGKIPTC